MMVFNLQNNKRVHGIDEEEKERIMRNGSNKKAKVISESKSSESSDPSKYIACEKCKSSFFIKGENFNDRVSLFKMIS